MKLLLNDRELKDIVSEHTPLGAALKTVQDEQLGGDQIIAEIMVDGEPLTAERLTQWRDRPVADFCETRIEAVARNKYAAASLQTLADCLERSAPQRDRIGDLLCKGQSTEAIKLLVDYMQIWSGVQQSLDSVCRLLELDLHALEVYQILDDSDDVGSDNIDADGSPLSVLSYVNRLSEQLTEIKHALEAGDLVLLGDILDYEFGEITNDWKNLLEQLARQFESD